MKAQSIMTPSPCCCTSADTIADVARLMRDNDCGAVPVVDHGRIVGIVTDRDLAVRALATGMDGSTLVADVMTTSPCCCAPDDDLRKVEKIMVDNQIRRVPVVDANGSCVGIIAQADIARAAADGQSVGEREIAIVVEAISEPSRGARPRNGSQLAQSQH
jgi:CBS domain-containing protein